MKQRFLVIFETAADEERALDALSHVLKHAGRAHQLRCVWAQQRAVADKDVVDHSPQVQSMLQRLRKSGAKGVSRGGRF